MSKTWIVYDILNLAYRSMRKGGYLSHGGHPTGALYSVFRDMVNFQDRWGTHHCAFAFDLGKGLREQKYPWYKLKRRRNQKDPQIEEVTSAIKEQVESLRKNYLEQLGYPNVFYQVGYEADDIIASICQNLPIDDEAIIVSGDEDLFQLISNQVMLYTPGNKTLWTKKKFKKHYGISPHNWVTVKALGGCVTDEVPGCSGVSEILAAKFLKDEIPKHHKVYPKIQAFLKTQQFKDNMEVVQLPYPGTNDFELVDHEPPTRSAWKALMEKLGMQSLADHDPSSPSRNLFAGR